MKKLLYISLIITVVIVINELFYLNEINLAWVVLSLSIAVGLQTYYLIKKHKR